MRVVLTQPVYVKEVVLTPTEASELNRLLSRPYCTGFAQSSPVLSNLITQLSKLEGKLP